MQTKVQGFNYIELVITFAVIGGLAAIAYPAFKNYTKRASYNNLVQIANSYQDSVAECMKDTKKLSECNGGTHGIPANITKPKGPVQSVIVKAGVVTVTPVAHGGIKVTDTYVLTPVVVKDAISWKTSGGAVMDEFVD